MRARLSSLHIWTTFAGLVLPLLTLDAPQSRITFLHFNNSASIPITLRIFDYLHPRKHGIIRAVALDGRLWDQKLLFEFCFRWLGLYCYAVAQMMKHLVRRMLMPSKISNLTWKGGLLLWSLQAWDIFGLSAFGFCLLAAMLQECLCLGPQWALFGGMCLMLAGGF